MIGQRVRLLVFPRYYVRANPWVAEGKVFSINDQGVTITRSVKEEEFGTPFIKGYYIPAIYFEEERVYVA